MTHMTLDKLLHPDPLLDDYDYTECGMEHPRLEGNLCINELDHKGTHEDADGNAWTGQDWINNR
jgi:hypothetical protein